MTKIKIKLKIKKPPAKGYKNPPLKRREPIEIPNTEFKAKDKVNIINLYSDLYDNIKEDKTYNVLEFVNADLSDMNCGVVYLKEYPTQPFVSHHFKKA